MSADARHDTVQAQKDYNEARKYMKKYDCEKPFDFARVEKCLQNALAADVRFGPAHHSLGMLYMWQRNLYLAAWEFEYASRLMPERFEPLNNLGLVYESADKFEQAIVFYKLAREKAPNQPEVIGNLARATYRSGQRVDQMRPLLEDVVATSENPDWRRWAAELLGVNPIPIGANATPDFKRMVAPSAQPLPVEPAPTIEELPLNLRPVPDTNPPASNLEDAFKLPPLPDLLQELEFSSPP